MANVQRLLADLESRAKFFSPTVTLDLIGDKDDNKLLELAETCQADYLVTGNTNDFTFSEHKGTKILTPRAFFERLNQ